MRLVTNAEKIVLRETQRAFMYFGLYGFTVDAVIVNRLLPAALGDPFFDKWRKTQAQFLAEAKRYFDPVPIWTVPLKDDQVVGMEDLAELGAALFAGADPAASFRTTAPYSYQKKAGHYLLTLDLPFVEREDVELAVASGDLVVTLGNFRHHIPIPRTLSGHVPTKAKVEAGRLTVRFERAREEATAWLSGGRSEAGEAGDGLEGDFGPGFDPTRGPPRGVAGGSSGRARRSRTRYGISGARRDPVRRGRLLPEAGRGPRRPASRSSWRVAGTRTPPTRAATSGIGLLRALRDFLDEEIAFAERAAEARRASPRYTKIPVE